MAELFNRQWSRQALLERVGHIEQIAGVRAVEATDGAGRGSRVFSVYTGAGLAFDVVADRALDIGACTFKGLPLAWASPAGLVHPGFYEAEGLGWLRSFGGGLVTTCGLDHFGAPAVDGGEAFGIHGRISSLPAEQASYRTFWQGDDYVLEVSGSVRQARLFGENLLLQRRIVTTLGATSLVIEDTVTNQGFAPQPHMILYHCNLGFPLVDAESRIVLDTGETVARDSEAARGLDAWDRCQAPTPSYREQVFRHAPRADADGHCQVRVENPVLGLALAITYDQPSLPHLFQWKMMGQGAYVLGIEPANSSAIEGRAVARERDDLPHLAPGESRSYRLTFEPISLRIK